MRDEKSKMRFKNVNDDWKEIRVKDLSSKTIGGGTPKTSQREYWAGEIPWIRSSDLKLDKILNIEYKEKITDKAIRNSAAHIVPADSITVVTRVGLGKVGLLDYEYSTSQDFLSFVDLQVNKYFMVFLLYKLMRKESHISQGTSIKGVTKKDLLNKKVTVPKSKIEQTKIGKFFKELDELIEFQQLTVDNIKKVKDGFSQKIFPDKKDINPKIRTGLFNDTFVNKAFKNISKHYNGLSGKTKKDFGKGDGKYITYVNVLNNPITDKHVWDSIEKDGKQNIVSYGDLLVTTSSETFEEVGMTSVWVHKEDRYLNSFCFGIKFNDGFRYDPYYLTEVMRSELVRKNIIILGQGISRINISKIKFMDIEVPFPSLKEQIKIGSLFKQLDELIELEKQELESLQKMKKGFLQKMFV